MEDPPKPKHAGGRPPGSPNKVDRRPWTRAIERAVHRTAKDGKTKRLDLLADRLVSAGLKGDVPALKEIGDRLEGRPITPVEMRVNRTAADFSEDELDTLITAAGLASEPDEGPPIGTVHGLAAPFAPARQRWLRSAAELKPARTS